MAKDLTESQHDRQNILNNRYALQQAERYLELGGVEFQGETVFTKQQVMALFEISERTIERYLESHSDELSSNGHRLLKGKKLREFKVILHGTDINDGTKTSVLSIFSFRAVLNLGMLLTESEPARFLRSRLLDIVLDVMAERVGGHTKYINQRDDYVVQRFVQDMENIAVWVADNAIGKDLLHQIISSILYEDDYSEALKLEIFEALESAELK